MSGQPNAHIFAVFAKTEGMNEGAKDIFMYVMGETDSFMEDFIEGKRLRGEECNASTVDKHTKKSPF